MTRDITLEKAKEKLCPFMVDEGKPKYCVGDHCMSWEFTSEPKSVPNGCGGFVSVLGDSNDCGICKLLSKN